MLLNGYGMVELGGLAMMGVELSLLPGSGDLCFPVPPFQHSRRRRERPAVFARASRASARFAAAASRRTIGRTRTESEGLLTSDGWLRTGDLATRNRFGLIRMVGRMKDVIKSGGYSVYVRELEEAMLAHPAVARAVAFGLPHKEKGEIPAAAVELQPGSPAGESDLLEWCRKHLAAYKAPRRIWILDPGGLPQNHNGKISQASPARAVLRTRSLESC